MLGNGWMSYRLKWKARPQLIAQVLEALLPMRQKILTVSLNPGRGKSRCAVVFYLLLYFLFE